MSAVLKWLIASAGRSFSTAVPEQLRLLPLLFKVTHSLINSKLWSDSFVTPGLKILTLNVCTMQGLKMMLAFLLTYLCPLLQIAPVENDDSYDELKRDAKTCLSLMSQGLLYTEQIPMVLSALQEVSHLAAVAAIPLFTCITHDWAFLHTLTSYNI